MAVHRPMVRSLDAAGYAAAAALVPYLLIKISWVVGGALGLVPLGQDRDLAGWIVLNLVTIVMAAAGIALGLALVRPWGRRIPTLPLLACAWLGSGFLVPMLPYLTLTSLLPASGTTPDDGPAMPAWEGWLIQASFLAMAAALAVALPVYLRPASRSTGSPAPRRTAGGGRRRARWSWSCSRSARPWPSTRWPTWPG